MLKTVLSLPRFAAMALWLAASVAVAAGDEPARVTLLAGADDGTGAVDGTAAAARFADIETSAMRNRAGLAVDHRGTIFVADLGNQVIRRVSPQGRVQTFAGAFGQRGAVDGEATRARFNDPAGLAIDSAGNVYVADSSNHLIRRIDAQGRVSTVAGLAGVKGFADGRGAQARFSHPQGLAFDRAGNLLITDLENHLLRRMTPEGVVTTLAGRAGLKGDQDGPRAEARLNYPMGLAIDRHGKVLVSQLYVGGIRRISGTGEVSTLKLRLAEKTWGEAVGDELGLSGANALLIDAQDRLVVAHTPGHRLRMISPSGDITNLAGQFERGRAEGLQDGPLRSARFYEPSAMAFEPSGDLLVLDTGNATLRRIKLREGMVSTVAGKARKRFYAVDSIDGRGTNASFSFQGLTHYAMASMTVDPRGTFYVAEVLGKVIRAVQPDGSVRTLAGLAGAGGAADGTGNEARFQSPVALAVWAGALYVCDSNNSALRKISLEDGKVTTFAGALGMPGHLDGALHDSRFGAPTGIAINARGEMFVSDAPSHTVRKIDAEGKVSTLAGQAGVPGEADGLGQEARFNQPGFLTLDRDGNLFVVDGRQSNRVRRVSPDGRVTTPSQTWAVPRALSQVVFRQIASLPSGDLLVVEANSQVVWRVASDGAVSLLAGMPDWPGLPRGELPGPLDHPSALVVDAPRRRVGLSSGNAVFVIDLK